jgi:threonine dehydrogenase-like Zn-dependent dehydrogenase
MKALVFSEGKLKYDNSYPEPDLKSDEVLIAVKYAGICNTDFEILKGYMGFSGVLGHEFVGTVAKGPKALTGKRVVAEINCLCGKCEMCQSGLSNHCLNRKTIGIDGHDGAFAEYLAIPQRNVHLLPDNVSNEEAIFVEPLAAAMQIVQQVPIEQRHKVAVIGDGKLGLLAVQVLANSGSKGNVVLVGKNEHKLMFAEKRGIQGIMLNDMLLKPQWDVVVDCSGTTDGFATACKLVKPRGKLVLKSTWVSDKPVDMSLLVVNEVTLIGSRCGPFANAINALAADQIVTNGLITARFPLADGVEAMEKAKQPNQIKVLLEI